jgi:hypothetical protein
VLCPEGPASGDHFDVVSSLRQGADVKNRVVSHFEKIG